MEGLVVRSGAFGANKMYIRYKISDMSAALPAKGVGLPTSLNIASPKQLYLHRKTGPLLFNQLATLNELLLIHCHSSASFWVPAGWLSVK
jgi:hypothetical protein